MDAAKKQKLIDTLSIAKNFDENLGEKSRTWFVGKVIAGFEAVGGATDTQITQKTTDLVTLAKTRVAAERDFAINLTADGNKRFNDKAIKATQRHRVEILYGAIAHEPKLAETAQKDYLLFIARRRFRSVCRIYFWVNPNSQGYFRYPHKCATDQRWRVNEDAAAAFWERENPANDLPVKLKPAGVTDPVAAVQKLFVTKTEACKGNLFDCAVVAGITTLDSMLEAKTPATFLKALPPAYLNVNHMDYGEFVVQQADTKNPMKTVPVAMPPRDLQVGDQCYIWNHPLYKAFRPTGSWTGEFSFVFISGDRDHRSKKGFVFGGHGKNGTLFQFYNAFVTELASYLTLARRLAQVHLVFMAGGAAAIAPSTATEVEDDVQIYDPATEAFKPAARHRLIAYDATVLARDFTKVPSKTKPKPKSVQPGFLVVQSKAAHTFYLVKVDKPDEDKSLMTNLKKTIAEVPGPTRQVKYPIKIQRKDAPPSGATPSQIYAIENSWSVSYLDRATNTERFWPFFEMVGGVLKRKELTTDNGDPSPDLFDAPFQPINTASTDLRVYQPRIDFAAHRTFLSGNGAF